MAARLTVVYTGGETETITIRPLGMVAAERQYGAGTSNGHSMEAMLYGAWFLKGKPGASFDDWLGTIEELKDEEEPTVPLDEEPSPEQLPISQ